MKLNVPDLKKWKPASLAEILGIEVAEAKSLKTMCRSRVNRPTVCSSCRSVMWKTKPKWYRVTVSARGNHLLNNSYDVRAKNAGEARARARGRWNNEMKPHAYACVRIEETKQGGH